MRRIIVSTLNFIALCTILLLMGKSADVWQILPVAGLFTFVVILNYWEGLEVGGEIWRRNDYEE